MRAARSRATAILPSPTAFLHLDAPVWVISRKPHRQCGGWSTSPPAFTSAPCAGSDSPTPHAFNPISIYCGRPICLSDGGNRLDAPFRPEHDPFFRLYDRSVKIRIDALV